MFKGLLNLTVFVFALVLALPAHSANHEGNSDDANQGDNKITVMEGTLICVRVSEDGEVETTANFTECSGTVVMVGAEKAAAISAKKEDMKDMHGGKQSVSGEMSGHTRGWILGTVSAINEKESREASISGALVCLLPNYQDGSIEPVIATSACSGKGQHLHVLTTSGGQVYAIHGSEEAIGDLESLSDRNVELQGRLQGDQGAWVLYVN